MGKIKRNNGYILQAVVFTDTFNNEFYPLTQDIPSTLIPLLNKPILSYTLEFLYLSGVREVTLFCKSGVPAINEFLRKAQEEKVIWSTSLKINLVVSKTEETLGDCLRVLDSRGKIRGDFVLVEPGAIANIDLKPIFKKHREISRRDKGLCMTMICMNAGVEQTLRCSEDNSLYVTTQDDKLVIFENRGKSDEKTPGIMNIMLQHEDGLMWNRGLRDMRISICSPKFLPLFTDNFDFQTKEEFIKNLLINEEILNCTMYVHKFAGNQHGGAVLNWQNYQTTSFEVFDMYYKKSGKVELLCRMKEIHPGDAERRTIVGRNSKIPPCAKLSKCILGENVTIGKNVCLENSFIFSDCVIGDNVKVSLSVVGPNCTLKDNCQIMSNCVLGKNVQIEENTTINNCLVQATRPESCDDADILGQYAYKTRVERREVVPEMNTPEEIKQKFEEALVYVESDDDQDSSDSPQVEDAEIFLNEVIESLTRGIEDDVKCENLIFEINGSRYAYDIPLEEVNFSVVKAILIMYSQEKASGLRYLSKLLTKLSGVIKNYIRSENSMRDCLAAIEDHAVGNAEEEEDWVLYVLKWFYNEEILSEEVIVKWGSELDTEEKLFIKINPFLTWLKTAEEESSEED